MALGNHFIFRLLASFGSTGLLIFKMALGLGIIHLLSSYYFSHEKNIPAYVLYFSLLTPIFALRDFVRPQLFTFLFTTMPGGDPVSILSWQPTGPVLDTTIVCACGSTVMEAPLRVSAFSAWLLQ